MKKEKILQALETLGVLLLFLFVVGIMTSTLVALFAFDLGLTIGVYCVAGLMFSSLLAEIRNF
jgi:hypothetical protein